MSAASAPPISIAVLPLRAQGLETFLADGFTESVIQALSRLPGLRVTGRTSVFAFRGRDLDLRLIGQQLSVGLILEGSLRANADIIQLKVSLISTSAGHVLWTNSISRPLGSWFELEAELSEELCKQLLPALQDPEVRHRHAQAGTENVAAYDHYLKALHEFRQFRIERIPVALRELDRALELDPGFAVAYAARANCMHLLRILEVAPLEDLEGPTQQAIQMALKLGPQLGETWLAQAIYLLIYQLDLPAAHQAFERALFYSPGLPEVHEFYSFYLTVIGADGAAIAAARRAVEIDPLSPNMLNSMGYTYFIAGQYQQAISWFDQALTVSPGHLAAHESKALTLLKLGETAQCLQLLEQLSPQHNLSVHRSSMLGLAYGYSGQTEAAREQLAILLKAEEGQDHRSFDLDALLIHQVLGEEEFIRQRLDRILRSKSKLFLLLTHPFLRELRASALFRQQLQIHQLDAELGDDGIRIQAETRESLKISLRDLLYVESEDNYCRFVWSEEEGVRQQLLRLSIKSAAAQLAATPVVRVHRSYLVHMGQAWTIRRQGREMQLRHQLLERSIPVARSSQAQVKALRTNS